MPRAGGFAYLSLIILIALIGLGAAAGLSHRYGNYSRIRAFRTRAAIYASCMSIQ